MSITSRDYTNPQFKSLMDMFASVNASNARTSGEAGIEEAKAFNQQKRDKLQSFLQGQQMDHQSQIDQGNMDHKITSQKDADMSALTTKIGLAKGLNKEFGGKVAVNVSENGISLNPHDNSAMMAERHQKMVDREREGLSKRYEKISPFNTDMQELEANTTTPDGRGGILTNPNAKLKSMGGFKSVLPDSVMGLAEMIGAVPKGTSAERKALQRLQIDYQQSKSGMRVTDAARKQEAAAMGRLASGDPDLTAKAIRSLGHGMKDSYGTMRAGYSPEAVGEVHKVMGDPSALYGNVYDDNQPLKGTPKTIRVRDRKTGQTGTLDESEFDANLYDRIN